MESTREVEIEKYGSKGNVNPMFEKRECFVGYVMMGEFEERWTVGADMIWVKAKTMEARNDRMMILVL
jgi:hypothetical protein